MMPIPKIEAETPSSKCVEIELAWQTFFETGTVDSDAVRPEILASWKRSVARGLHPDAPKAKIKISHEDLKIIKAQNRGLIEAALPVMVTLCEAVKDTGFILTLADHNGIVLEIFGDADVLKFSQRNNYAVGCCRTEAEVGTNAIGLCLITKAPTQINGAEHFNARHHTWTCSSAPIVAPNGRLTGVVTLSGESHNAHKHTLGMVISTANSISEKLQGSHSSREHLRMGQMVDSILRSISEAIITVDAQGVITHANPRAQHLIGIDIDTLRGASIKKVFPENPEVLKTVINGDSLAEVEAPVERNGKRSFMRVKSYAFHEPDGHTGALLFITEKKAYLNGVREASGLQARYNFEDICGAADSLYRQIELAKMAASTESRVLITGETGTGKELFAQSIHNASERRNGPFVAINCAAIPRDLIESEIMGYAHGAYTGAKKGGQIGKLELAEGGTVFLDEISQMPLDMQAKFLRVLQESTITRLGDTKPVNLDIRVIAATNEDLYEKGVNQSFRHDLYFRLSVIEINIPALRERPGDLDLLSQAFLDKTASRSHSGPIQISIDALALLKAYHWPGNIRELENILEMAALTCQDGLIRPADLASRIRGEAAISSAPAAFLGTPRSEPASTPAPGEAPTELMPPTGEIQSLRDTEMQSLRNAMTKTNGNVTEVSRILGISRSSIYRRLKEYGINKVVNYS